MADGQNPPTDATTAEEGGTPAPSTEPGAPSTPPWGDEFDPARAWKTIQSLREIEKSYKAEKAAWEKAEQERADAEKTELQRLADKAAEAEKRAQALELAQLRAKAAKEHSLPDDLVEFLTGTTEESLAEQAKRLAERVAATKPSTEPGTPGRPQPRLTPGQGADESTEFDPVAIARAARRGY